MTGDPAAAPAAGPGDDPLPALARRCRGALETLHVVAYFAPEPAQEYRALGLRGRDGYFASRSAPLGAIPAAVTVATFYVFAPSLVARSIPAAWDLTDPATVLAARHRGVAAALHRVLDTADGAGAGAAPDVAEALELTRTACATLAAPGRPIYAAHAALPWPDDPLLALWHAATLLREHRGDAHVAALLLAGLDPVEALVTAALASRTPGPMTAFLKATRGWTPEEWAAGEDRLRARGLLDADGALTADGVTLRADVEARTDAAAADGWRHLGVDGTACLLDLVGPLQRAVLDSDVFPQEWFPRR